MQKNSRACIISFKHAFWLNQRGKLSFREAYHDHENHDYNHETDSKTFHIVRVHSRDHHRHVTAAKNGPKRQKNGKKWPKMERKRNMRMIRIHSRLPRYNLYTIPDTLHPVFRHFQCQNGCWSDGKNIKSLLNFSRFAQKHDQSGAKKQSPYSYASCGAGDCFVAPTRSCFCANLEKFNKPYFFQHSHFWPFNSFGGPSSVDIKSTALSRRTTMTGQKNSQPQTS